MQDRLRDQIVNDLVKERIALLCTAATDGRWSMPVRYRLRPGAAKAGLCVECLVPRWADVLYGLEQEPRVTLIVLLSRDPPASWLHISGTARKVAKPVWGAWATDDTLFTPITDLYIVVRVNVERADSIDESIGWGISATAEW